MPLDGNLGDCSPFAIGEQGAAILAYHEAVTKPLEENAATIAAREGALRKAAKQAFNAADNTFDITRADGFPSDRDEAFVAIVRLQSELAGYRAAHAEQVKAAVEAADAEAAKEQARLDGTGKIKSGPTRVADLPSQTDYILSQGFTHDHFRQANRAGSAFSVRREIPESIPDRDIKAALFSTGSADPEALRDPGWVPMALRPLYLIDAIPAWPCDSDTVVYMEETTHTGAATSVNEGTALGESTFGLTERSVPVRDIGHYLPMSQRVLEDFTNIRMYIDGVMPEEVRRKVDAELVTGDGTGLKLQGLAEAAGAGNIPLAKNADGSVKDPIDALWDAKQNVRFTGRATATHYCLNPNYWNGCMKAKSDSGGYFGGNPWGMFSEMMWGIPVIQNDNWEWAASKKAGCCMDLTGLFIRLRFRRDVTTEVGLNADDFIKLQTTIRSYVRVAHVIQRGAAICHLTRAA